MPKSKSSKPNNLNTPIDRIKHEDKRANIPTEELKNFMKEENKAIKTTLYPRDTSLDPQLVWQGKDEQDSQELEVPSIPIYLQEKIQPQALIEDFRNKFKKGETGEQLSLFRDFNDLEFEEAIDFYHHDLNWSNRLILGDSLLVMNSLAERESLKGKVQMIYLDPPYGIKFGSNWQVSTRKRDVKDGKSEDVTRQPEQVKAFRDTWELGIHSYLSYLRDRLVVARELLTESGSIFVQIGEENLHIIRNILDEVLGSENFMSMITFRVKNMPFGAKYLENMYDHVIWYAKDKEKVKYRQLFTERQIDLNEYSFIQTNCNYRKLTSDEKSNPNLIHENSRLFSRLDIYSSGYTTSCIYNYCFHGNLFKPQTGKSWKTTEQGMSRLKKSDRLINLGSKLYFKFYFNDYPFTLFTNFWNDTAGGFSETKTYIVQTHPKVIQRCLLMTTDPGDLVLDPTCGSGTTAYVAEQWGRRWITIDTSRVALALARTRLMTAKYPYYLLADSPEGIAKEAEITGQFLKTNLKTERNIKKGFVYKRVPHITLGAIANNEEIDTIHEKWQGKLEPIRSKLNQLLKQKWEEWEIPREPESKWSQETKDLLTQWWELRQKRQKEIDESIARKADYETLYDQPIEDNKKIRVAGPFTVESLSPHRILSTAEERPASEKDGQLQASDQFEMRIIENLRKAGVQNTIKQERLKFDSLEPYAGTWLQADGEYTEADGTVKRATVSIGPEYGTVGTEQIKEAAKEAIKGIGYDLLIVCGFAFEPSVAEESKNYGKLQVLITKMNPDLLLGDELLKKTGSGNLFLVFGEPDIEIKSLKDGQIQVELKGLDIYDPTTGEIRSSSTDDIACWFIDTDYNGESFVVRHAYFTGADQPYDKLKRTLKSEINEEAWSQLYSTTSRPFSAPKKSSKGGKIAVKVINHYGDEVLKVYDSRYWRK